MHLRVRLRRNAAILAALIRHVRARTACPRTAGMARGMARITRPKLKICEKLNHAYHRERPIYALIAYDTANASPGSHHRLEFTTEVTECLSGPACLPPQIVLRYPLESKEARTCKPRNCAIRSHRRQLACLGVDSLKKLVDKHTALQYA